MLNLYKKIYYFNLHSCERRNYIKILHLRVKNNIPINKKGKGTKARHAAALLGTC